MNKSTSESSSDTSSGSYSSDESIHENDLTNVNVMDMISWNSHEGNLSKFVDTFKQFSTEEKVFLLKSRCLSNNCTCNFKNYDLLFARVFVGLKVLVGKWCKLRFSKGAVPDTDVVSTFMFFKDFQGWYEILNENLEVIPFWNNVSQIVQNKPKSFILRRDSKCMFVKECSEDSTGHITFDNTLLKGGTILSFAQCRKYSVKKGRRIKEQYLAKCKDSKGNCFYFIPEETIYASPIAGFDNISGAHSFQSMIEKFHFPINVKPIFMSPPVPNLPCSDRHFLQLSQRFELDLIVVTPLKDSSRFFLLTPNLFNDHVFKIGEFLPESVTKHTLPPHISQHIVNQQSKIENLFAKCHKFDTLSYLLKHAEDTSKISPKFEVAESEFDDIYVEVEGIYFFIRNGYFPRNTVQGRPKVTECPPVTTETLVSPNEKLVEPPKIDSEEDESDDEDGESSDMSSTSTDTDRTSSNAVEMCIKSRLKQAKSMPLHKSKNMIENSQFSTSNSRFNLDLTVKNTSNMSITGASVTETDTSGRRVTEVPRFYKNQALLAHRFKETDIDITLLKDTMV